MRQEELYYNIESRVPTLEVLNQLEGRAGKRVLVEELGKFFYWNKANNVWTREDTVGDYKNYTSLNLLAAVFNIPSPKDDIDGSMVHKVYWEDNDLERIRIYCEKDVITTAQILLKFKSLAALSTDQITIVEP